MIRKTKRYGWRHSLPDPRDLIYNDEVRILSEMTVPPTADLEAEMPPVWDQGRLGSCVSHGTAAVMEHAQARQGEASGTVTPSRLFIYYNGRVLEGAPPDQDTGLEVRTGIKELVTYGAPPETDWAYSDANPGPFQRKPPANIYLAAARYEAVQYMKVTQRSGAPMRTAISGHLPVVFGFPVPDRFEDPSWNPARDYLPLPDASTQFVGGHCTVVVGYDWTRTRFSVPVFKVRNSWGSAWGENGHFYMDAGWFSGYRNLAADCWVIRKVTS